MRKEQIIESLKNAINPDQLRKIFRDLAFVCHPDCGGTNEGMRVLIEQYERILRAFSGQSFMRKNRAGEYYEKKYEYNSDLERDIAEKLQVFVSTFPADVEIEVRGTWVYLFGNTKPHAARLGKKGFGMRWKAQDLEWQWHSEFEPKFKTFAGYKSQTKEQIRARYGAESHTGRQQGVR